MQNGDLRDNSCPLPVDIAHMGRHGCMVSNTSVDADWAHDDCTNYLEGCFPKAFDFARKNAKHPGDVLWTLVAKEKQRLRAVPEDNPTGADLAEWKTDKKSGTSSVHLYISE